MTATRTTRCSRPCVRFPEAGGSCIASAGTPISPAGAPAKASSRRSRASSRFPRSDGIQDAARTVAEDGYVVETNSPFLSPAPERGKPNLPERVAITAAAVAKLRGVSVEDVRAATTRTAHRVLGIGTPHTAAARA